MRHVVYGGGTLDTQGAELCAHPWAGIGERMSTPPETLAGGADRRPVRAARNPHADHHRAVRVIGLALVAHMFRSRRLYERVAVGAIILAALAGMGRENRAKTFARLEAWVKREDERLERKVKRALT
jgi:hypothetical protein